MKTTYTLFLKKALSVLLVIGYLLVYSVSSQELSKDILTNSKGLPAYIVLELNKIAKSAGETSLDISSKQRTVQKQVEVMLDYYITCERVSDLKQKEKCGIELAKKVYDKECHAGFSEFKLSDSRAINVERMGKALTASLILLGDQRVCMNHVVIPEIITNIIAVDIKPSSVKNWKTFYEAVKNNERVVQFYYPVIIGVPKSEVKDAAFHIGFLRR